MKEAWEAEKTKIKEAFEEAKQETNDDHAKFKLKMNRELKDESVKKDAMIAKLNADLKEIEKGNLPKPA